MSSALDARIQRGLEVVSKFRPYFRGKFSGVISEWKQDATRITESDLFLSDHIIAELKSDFPSDAYCSEEIGDEVVDLTKSEFAWVLDPIDGTNNFALGMSTCCISLGLLKDGFPIYGIIYDYSLDAIIHGGSNKGAFIDQNKVVVTEDVLTENAIFAIQSPMNDEQIKIYSPLLKKYSIRSFGSGALNMVYSGIGMLHGSIEFRVRVWDIAAAYPIIIEAGAEAHFFGEKVFPLETFHTKLERCPLVTGIGSFCKEVLHLMDASKN